VPTSPPRDPVLHAVGLRIRRAREARGLSLEALAERSGLSSRSIIGIEHGRSDMRLRSLLAIAAALEVAPGELLAD